MDCLSIFNIFNFAYIICRNDLLENFTVIFNKIQMVK